MNENEMDTEMTQSLDELTLAQLRTACKENSLPAGGGKKDLRGRLRRHLFGSSEQHTPAMTKCRICGARASVAGTRKRRMADGRLMVTRQMRCHGKHRHSYPLPEIVEPDQP